MKLKGKEEEELHLFSVEKGECDFSQGFPSNQPNYVNIQGSCKGPPKTFETSYGCNYKSFSKCFY